MSTFFVLLCLLYGIPIFLGIQLLYFVLKRHSTKARIIRKILLIALLVFIVVSSLLDWQLSRHTDAIRFNSKYQLKVIATEEEAFLDYPVAFEFEFTDVKTGASKNFEFETGDGPRLEIYPDNQDQNVIYIVAKSERFRQSWVIDLQENRINSTNELPLSGDSTKSYLFTSNFQLKKRFR